MNLSLLKYFARYFIKIIILVSCAPPLTVHASVFNQCSKLFGIVKSIPQNITNKRYFNSRRRSIFTDARQKRRAIEADFINTQKLIEAGNSEIAEIFETIAITLEYSPEQIEQMRSLNLNSDKINQKLIQIAEEGKHLRIEIMETVFVIQLAQLDAEQQIKSANLSETEIKSLLQEIQNGFIERRKQATLHSDQIKKYILLRAKQNKHNYQTEGQAIINFGRTFNMPPLLTEKLNTMIDLEVERRIEEIDKDLEAGIQMIDAATQLELDRLEKEEEDFWKNNNFQKPINQS